MRKSWPEETRLRALEVYRDHGAAAAHKETGVPAATVRSWASRANLRGPRHERLAAAHATAQATAAEVRARIARDLYAKAERLVGQLFKPTELVKVVTVHQGRDNGSEAEVVRAELDEPTPGDKRHLAVATAVLLQQAQLLSGEATQRYGETPRDWERELEAFTIGAAAGHHQPKVTEGLAEPAAP